MTQEIAMIQIETDMRDLLKDIKAGLTKDEYEKSRDRILEKVKKNHLEFWATLKWLKISKAH